MEKRMNTYINALCGSDLDILCKLISDQYKHFIHFYRLVEDVSEDIEYAQYKIESEDCLSIDLWIVSSRNSSEIRKYLEVKVSEETYSCEIKQKKQKISIVLKK